MNAKSPNGFESTVVTDASEAQASYFAGLPAPKSGQSSYRIEWALATADGVWTVSKAAFEAAKGL